MQGIAQRGGPLIGHIHKGAMVSWKRHHLAPEPFRELSCGVGIEPPFVQRSVSRRHTDLHSAFRDDRDIRQVVRHREQLLRRILCPERLLECAPGKYRQAVCVNARGQTNRRNQLLRQVASSSCGVTPNANATWLIPLTSISPQLAPARGNRPQPRHRNRTSGRGRACRREPRTGRVLQCRAARRQG
jgi:hypothetical protein